MKRLLAGVYMMLLLLPVVAPSAAAAEPRPGDPLWVRTLPGIAIDIAWSPDGELIAVAQGVTYTVDVYDKTGSLVWSLTGRSAPKAVAWRPDGEVLAVAYSRELILYDPDTHGIVAQRKFDSTITSIAWSPDSSYLALTTEAGGVWVFDSVGEPVYYLTGPNTPATASAWTPDSRFLLVGDGMGQVIVYDITSPFEFKRFNPLGEAVTSIAVSPEGIVAVSSRSKTLLGTVSLDGDLLITTSVPYGAVSGASWSPDGEALALPDGGRVVVIGSDGAYKGIVPGAGDYPVYDVAWNPVDYSLLAVSGYYVGTGDSKLALVYSGALYTLTVEDPVVAVCRLQHCGTRLTVAAWEKTLEFNVTLPAREWPSMDPVNATLTLTIEAHPFETRTITVNAEFIAASPSIRVPGDMGLLLLFKAPDAQATLRRGEVEADIEGIATLAPPGGYELVLSLEPPPDWLGPAWALTKKMQVSIPAGGSVVLDYSWYSIPNVTASLRVETEPGTLLTLRFRNDTVQAIVESTSRTYTVPTGSYVVSLQLPSSSDVLVESPDYLAVDLPVTLYPGDLLHVTLHYMDLLGRITVEAPEATMIRVYASWAQEPVATAVSQGAPLAWWAQPGTYSIHYTIPAPEGWLGPQPPSGASNVTVVAGATVTVSLYEDPDLQEFLSLLASSATIRVSAPEGYTVVVDYDNRSVAVEPGAVLVAPPGNYTFVLLASDGRTVVDEEKITVRGPANITVELAPPEESGPGQAPVQPPPESEGGRSVPKAALLALALIPVVAGLAGYFLLIRRRRAPAGGAEYW